ncbi:MAG: tetratricopeptide repeat protein [Actinomycetota bacterium]|nr:tetratricopeptide repeat protein [Actinomycetota bacterium]
MNRAFRLVTLISVGLLFLALPACHRTPINPDVRLQQGLAAQRAGDLDGAAAAYEDVLDVRPNDKYALYNLGVIAQGDGVTQLAEGYYRSALDADPNFEPALFNLAIIRTSVGATQEAVDLYRRLIAVAPKNANAHFNLGILLQRAGKDQEATAEFNVAIKIDPSLAGRLVTNPILPGSGTNGGASATGTPSATVTP